ncbi:uncharacterized protein LOC105843462 [Hydra vulgaris]|uniref:Uncharacterized protein LOC105843462 n=1 Tax=Hydra vulgaris TaxID=6087 RepID=A0ABM4BJ68_HYDVU
MNRSESKVNDISKQNSNDYLNVMILRLQESAKLEPIKVACTVTPLGKPWYFGEEFHGKLSKEEEKKILEGKVGRYLVRECLSNSRAHEYTLAFNFNKNIHHMKLIFNPTTNKFKVETGNKEFSNVLDLVTDILELLSNLNKSSISDKKEPYCKPHSFKMVSYKYPRWCDNCHQFLWGFFHQGLKCEDCDMNVHKTCQDNASLPCSKVVVSNRKISISPNYDKSSEKNPRNEAIDIKRPYYNDCKYFGQCSRFLSAFNIRDTFVSLENKLTRCFCVNCIEKANLGSKGNEKYKQFLNWTKFQLKQQKEGLKSWEVGYFPIKPQCISDMLSSCYNNQITDNGFDLIVAPSLANTVKDMEKENWSYQFRNTTSDTFLYAQTVMEVLLAPNSFQAVFLSTTFDNESEQHWRIQDKKSVFPVSVLVKIFDKECLS